MSASRTFDHGSEQFSHRRARVDTVRAGVPKRQNLPLFSSSHLLLLIKYNATDDGTNFTVYLL